MPRFDCSTEEVESPAGKRFDAAVPPLSATAGLLLAAELVRLHAGTLVDEPHNFGAVELASGVPEVQRKIRHCRGGCRVRRPAALRQTIDRHSRWVHLDGEYRADPKRVS
jgi:hypothetical protein